MASPNEAAAAASSSSASLSPDISNHEADYSMALVPFQHQKPSPLEGTILCPIPISYSMPMAEQQAAATFSGGRRRVTKSVLLSMSDLFAVTLSPQSMDYISSLDLVMEDVYRNKTMPFVAQERWFTIAERLQDLRLEKRQRDNGLTIDWFFYQGQKKFRSTPELLFFIKYGFIPLKLKKRVREQIQEEPLKSNFLSEKEEELVNIYDINKKIIIAVDMEIKKQIQEMKGCTKGDCNNGQAILQITESAWSELNSGPPRNHQLQAPPAIPNNSDLTVVPQPETQPRTGDGELFIPDASQEFYDWIDLMFPTLTS